MTNKDIKVAVGMSGGVDSSLSAALLKEQKYQVTGVYLELWDISKQEVNQGNKMAAQICKEINIPFVTLDFKSQYQKQIIDWFYGELKRGRTPNPCIVCNRELKFGLFLDWAVKNGFDNVATGHYARIEKSNDQARLLMAKDKKKDQTYFLSQLNQKQLKRTIFPIGNLTKNEVRRKAKKRGLSVWDKKSSSNLCVVKNQQKFKDFLKMKIKEHQGKVLDQRGRVVGSHQGVEFYTIGQRHGFTVYPRISKTGPRYVIDKKINKNQLVVGLKRDLQRRQFEISELHWIDTKQEMTNRRLKCRIRYRGSLINCQIKKKKRNKYIVNLDENVVGVTSGQISVFYQEKECLGGGVIS